MKTVNAHVFSGVSKLNFFCREGLTKIIDEVVPLCPGGQGEQTMTSPLDCGRSHIKLEKRAEMKPAKRGMNIGAPGTMKPLWGADGTLKKLEGTLEGSDRAF